MSIKPVHEGKASRGLGSVSVLGRSLVLLSALGSEQRAGGVLESTSGTAFGLGQKYFPGHLRMPFKNQWPRTVLRSSHVAPRCEECDLTGASVPSPGVLALSVLLGGSRKVPPAAGGAVGSAGFS